MLEKKFYGLRTGIGIFFITLLFSLLGLFILPNFLLYDFFTSYSPAIGKVRPNVLFIDVSKKQRMADDTVWEPLIKSLKSMGASQISFMFFPENASGNFYQQAAQSENMLFVRKMTSLSKETRKPFFDLPPDTALEAGVHTAISIIGEPTFGANRQQFTRLQYEDSLTVTFEMAAARQYLGKLPEIASESFLIDFIGGTGLLPMITLDKVLAGDLIPELVAGRSVLIGSSGMDNAISISMVGDDNIVSSAIFHGYALETLLSDRVINETPWFINIVLVLLILTLSLMTYQRLDIRLSIGLTLFLFVIYGVFSWALLIYMQIWQPIVELVFAQFVGLAVFIQRRITLDYRALREKLLDTSAKIREHVFLPSFYESADPWAQVVAIINQSLDLSRLILLERVSSDHRIKEVKALNCTFEDIHEKRRDFERTPYSTAISKNGPIVVTDYLHGTEYAEIQYLVPLKYADDLFGFWVFGIAPEKVDARPNFEAIVQDFSYQIAELLYYRQQWLSNQENDESHLQRFLQLETDSQLQQDLNKSISLLEMRLNGLEDFLNGLSTAAILYDLFGRVILVNDTMVKLLEGIDLAPHEMTPLDLISRLTGMDSGKVRQLIENVLIERSQSTLLVDLIADSEKKYLLHISPLLKNSARQVSVDSTSPFNLNGILCEIINVTTVKNLITVKENLVAFVGEQLYTDMQEIKALSEKLTEADIGSEKQKHFLQMLKENIDRSSSMILKSDPLLSKDLWKEELESYPVDAGAAIEFSIAALRDKAILHGNTFEYDFSGQISLVFADVNEIRKLFNIIFLILLQDSAENTPVTIKLKEEENLMVYLIANTGFGMPNERFQQYFHGSDISTSEEFRKLHTVLSQVMRWGGQVEGYSEVGMGINFTVKLRRF